MSLARNMTDSHIFARVARVGLHIFLLKTLSGNYVILAIPLAGGITATLEACLLGLLLLWFLRTRIKKTSNKPEVVRLA